MKLEQRIKLITQLCVDDIEDRGTFFNDGKKKIVTDISKSILAIDLIEDYTVLETALIVFRRMNSLDLVDLEFIITNLCHDTIKPTTIDLKGIRL